MIGRGEIQRLAAAAAVDERTQERDYLLTWLLAAMADEPSGLIFKGGTCLRKCYIPNYRYSEDLDFSRDATSDPAPPEDIVQAWTRRIGRDAGIVADAASDRSSPGRVWVSFSGPLGARREGAIKVDISDGESLLTPKEPRMLLSDYTDLAGLSLRVPCYSLPEIWAEKTRSLMQRAEPRDLYDLAELATLYPELAEQSLVVFEEKARSKGLDPRQLRQLLARREPLLERTWVTRLGDQVGQVPPFQATWRAVKRVLRQAGYLSD